jgi:hypothetical protein
MGDETTQSPLIYNDSLDTYSVTNVLLIDTDISESQLFYDSANSDTFPILYSTNSDRSELFQLLQTKFPNGFNRLALVFHEPIYNMSKVFLNNSELFSETDLDAGITKYSDNLDFLIQLLQSNKVVNVDFLACNTLSYPKWKQFYELLQTQTSSIVGASNDATGNLNYGADWILESTGENVEFIYFTSNMDNYASILGSITTNQSYVWISALNDTQCTYFKSNTNSYPGGAGAAITYPIAITNSNTTSQLTVYFNTSFIINTTSQYFSVGSNNIIIDGQNNTVTVSIASYSGLIRNGTNTADGKSSITVKNISTSVSGLGTLSTSCGWICQQYFGKNTTNNTVTNCSNSGNISASSGGICGANCSIASITNCYNSGTVGGSGNSGGICGTSCSVASITNCYNTGPISGGATNAGSGGICGSSCSTPYINNCYNDTNATISGGYSGGICGSNCSNTVNISNCYNKAPISASNSGGICGSGCNASSITNCYNIGAINSNSGGICGGNCNATITNCYNLGNIGSACGGICGPKTFSATINKCYNIGSIAGTAGGICGKYCGSGINSSVNITNCYNTGSITGSGGGICGTSCGGNTAPTNSTINISNCYNTANITNTGGGICGADCGGEINSVLSNVNITNCHNTGTITGSGSGGGICGANCGGSTDIATPYNNGSTINIKNCYSTGGDKIYGNNSVSNTKDVTVYSSAETWSHTTAANYLTGTPTSNDGVGNTWAYGSSSQPQLLSAFTGAIYSSSTFNGPQPPNVLPYSTPTSILSSLSNISDGITFEANYISTLTGSISEPYDNSNNYITINPTTGVITFSANIKSQQPITFNVTVLAGYNLSTAPYNYNFQTITVSGIACFNRDTKILVLNNNLEEVYVAIQNLRIGDKVKTYLHGYKQIKKIGKGQLLNDPTIPEHCMFKMEKTDTNGLIEDLIVTGGHGIMVDELTESQTNIQENKKFNQTIDDKTLLLASFSDDFQAVINTDVYTYYHFMLENDGDRDKRYGVYANGLLVETPSENFYDWLPFTPL